MRKRSDDWKRAASLAVQLEKDAPVFFEMAKGLAGDPRVREVFGMLAEAKREQLRKFTDDLKSKGVSLPPVAKAVKLPAVFPIADFQKAECYVCGYSVEIAAIPDSCPRCGASKYAFEREIDPGRALEIAESGSHATAGLLRDAEKGADERLKPVIARQLQMEQEMLEEARRELRGRDER